MVWSTNFRPWLRISYNAYYFSIYRYTDTSRPLRPDERSSTTQQPVAETTEQPQDNLVIKEQKLKEELKKKEQKQREQKQKEQKLKPKPQEEDKWIIVGESGEELQTTVKPQVEDKWITVGENE